MKGEKWLVMGEHEVFGITEDSDLKLDVLGINKE